MNHPTSIVVHREGKHLAHVRRWSDSRGMGDAVCGGRFRFTDSGWHDARFDSLEQARAAAMARGNGMCRRCYATAAKAVDRDAAIDSVRWAMLVVNEEDKRFRHGKKSRNSRNGPGIRR